MPIVTERLGPGRPVARTAIGLVMRLELPLVALWLGLGWALSRITIRVVDWYVMTDELLYERLGISVDRLHSPLPRVHGVLVPNVNQLYPLLLATVYGHGYVPQSLHDAHVLNAFVMASASIPAFLLARRATGRRLPAYLVAILTVCVPWIVYSSFLLTEVAGYPAFLWAILAIQASVVAPSKRGDALAIAGLALATLARTQFIVLALVLPLVLFAYELGHTDTGPAASRLRRATYDSARKHRLLGWAYALLVAGGIALLAGGRLSSALGTYASTLEGNLLPNGIGRSLLEHLAVLALSVGILPFVIGGGWLLANAARPGADEAHAFALTATLTIIAVTAEVTIFDLRFGSGIALDRYLFYVVPLVLVAFACALSAGSWPVRSLLLPAGLATAGFLVARLPVYGALNLDTPVSDVNQYLLRSLHSHVAVRATLAVATLLLTALFVQASRLLRRSHLVTLLAVLTLAALPAETAFAFVKLFSENGTAGRPLTVQQGGVFDWIDQAVGTHADVTMVPYPHLPGDYWASIAYWWDVEFWNKSVDHAAYYPGEYEGTPSTFPKLHLRFDPKTGLANISPTSYVVQSDKETRFRFYGGNVTPDRDALLIDMGGSPWRADWLSFGLYDDGWTRPGVVARVRSFARPGQTEPLERSLVLQFEAPPTGPRRSFEVVSNSHRWSGRISSGDGPVLGSVLFCQPATGYTDITIRVSGASHVFGDMRNFDTFGAEYRLGGLFLSKIDLEGIGGPCRL